MQSFEESHGLGDLHKKQQPTPEASSYGLIFAILAVGLFIFVRMRHER
jgi:hypothetical protein